MRDTTSVRTRDGKPVRPWGEDSKVLLPDKNFLGASETDIIAIEREGRPETTSRRKPEQNTG